MFFGNLPQLKDCSAYSHSYGIRYVQDFSPECNAPQMKPNLLEVNLIGSSTLIN